MIALSPTFQARAGIDFTAAMRRVFIEYVPTKDELIAETGDISLVDPVMPFAAITPMSTGFGAVTGGVQVFTLPNGTLHFYLACEPRPDLTDWNERRIEAFCFLDQWLADILALSGQDDPTTTDGMGHLTITKAQSSLIDHAPWKSRATTGGKYYQSVGLTYGDEIG